MTEKNGERGDRNRGKNLHSEYAEVRESLLIVRGSLIQKAGGEKVKMSLAFFFMDIFQDKVQANASLGFLVL